MGHYLATRSPFTIFSLTSQTNWLSYGAAARHPCIMPNPETNLWKQGKLDADGTCGAIVKEGKDEALWEVGATFGAKLALEVMRASAATAVLRATFRVAFLVAYAAVSAAAVWLALECVGTVDERLKSRD